MKFNTLKYALLTLAMAAQVGCNDYLDKLPDNRTEIDSVDKIAQLIASSYPKGCYASMTDSRVDYVVDKGKGNENNSNTDPYFWRDVKDVSQDTPDYFWQKCYYSVAGVNHALAVLDGMSNAEKAEAEPYVGEGYVLRAFSHFLVASLYTKFFDAENDGVNMGIPYVYEPETVVIKQYERGTVKETKAKIEEDLEKGLKLLGSDAVYNVPRFHFTSKAANAFAARYYLFTGQWDKVIEHASKVIPEPASFTENGNVVSNDPANVYCANNFQPWVTDYQSVPSSTDIKEYYTSGDNPSNLLLTEMSSRLSRYANTWRYGMDGANAGYLYSVTAAGTKLAFRTYSSSSTHYYVPKFREHFVRTSINATTGTIYTIFPYLRNEEVLLNRAEAYVMTDQPEKALADLNVYARNRIVNYDEEGNMLTEDGLLAFYEGACNNSENFLCEYNAYGAASWTDFKRALILCILDFRNQEFRWEGLRYYDMHRYMMPVTHYSFSGEENTLYPGDDRWVLQIPESSSLSGLELNPRKNLLSKEW